MARGWPISGSPSDAAARALEREVFERVFGYHAVLSVRIARFTVAHEMVEAVISHVHEAWQPQEFRVGRRLDAEAGCAGEALIRTGPQSADGRSGQRGERGCVGRRGSWWRTERRTASSVRKLRRRES